MWGFINNLSCNYFVNLTREISQIPTEERRNNSRLRLRIILLCSTKEGHLRKHDASFTYFYWHSAGLLFSARSLIVVCFFIPFNPAVSTALLPVMTVLSVDNPRWQKHPGIQCVRQIVNAYASLGDISFWLMQSSHSMLTGVYWARSRHPGKAVVIKN